jgi:hypothetical protein
MAFVRVSIMTPGRARTPKSNDCSMRSCSSIRDALVSSRPTGSPDPHPPPPHGPHLRLDGRESATARRRRDMAFQSQLRARP